MSAHAVDCDCRDARLTQLREDVVTVSGLRCQQRGGQRVKRLREHGWWLLYSWRMFWLKRMNEWLPELLNR